MVAPRETLADRLGHAVGQQQALVVAEHRVAHRGLHADAGRAAGDDELLRAGRAQRRVEVGAVEAAEARLPEHGVAGLRPELADDRQQLVDAVRAGVAGADGLEAGGDDMAAKLTILT